MTDKDKLESALDEDGTKDSTLVKAEEGTLISTTGEVGSPEWHTNINKGLMDDEVTKSREINGSNEIPTHVTPTYMLFLKQFFGFMPLLILAAAIVTIGELDYPDFIILICMLLINATLGFREEYHAKKALDELSNSLESEITVVRNGSSMALLVSEIVTGDIVMLVGGNMVPADVKWLRGDVMSIDTAAMTGEPLPRKYPGEHGDVMLSGTTCKAGECYGQVIAVGTNTEMGKAQADVMGDKQVRVVSAFQKKIDIILYATISFSLLWTVAVLLVLGFGYDWFEAGQSREAVLQLISITVAAIPIALPLVMTVVMSLGASFLAKEHNAVVTSLPALQDVASMSILNSDKTGTLTTANMSIMVDSIYAVDGVKPAEILLYAYLSSNKDKKDDPIDRAIVSAFEQNVEAKKLLEEGEYNITDLIGFNNIAKRVVAFADHKKGKVTIAKGLVAKVLDTSAGGEDTSELQWKVKQNSDKRFLKDLFLTDKGLSKSGYKTIGIAVCNDNPRENEKAEWKFVGLLPMLDPPRHDTAATINSLNLANISVKMITGDHANVGRETARLIGLGTNILPGDEIRKASSEEEKNKLIWDADGFAAVLPSDKREVVLTLRNKFGLVTGMTGDGVNDAPALSAAHVGIAVQGATDAAKNAADLILTEAGLSPIYGAVLEARRIFARVKAYVVYRIAASLLMVMTFSIVIYATGCTIYSLFIILLALINDVSMIPVSYDRADATVKPQIPVARNLVALSAYFAVAQTLFSLLWFFAVANHSLDDFSLNQCAIESKAGERGDPTSAFIWLHLLIATELMIFSARAPGYFWKSRPSNYLLISVSIFIALGCFLAAFVPWFGTGVSGPNIIYIILWNIAVFVVLDIGKVTFRNIIGDSAGEIIESDALIEPVKKIEDPNEIEKTMKKKIRYETHKQSHVAERDRQISYEILDTTTFVGRVKASSCLDGFVRRPNASPFFHGEYNM